MAKIVLISFKMYDAVIVLREKVLGGHVDVLRGVRLDSLEWLYEH